MRLGLFLALLCLALLPASSPATGGFSDGDTIPGDGTDPILWEEEQPEVITSDDHLGIPINADDPREFDSAPSGKAGPSQYGKRRVDPYFADACEMIRRNRDRFPQQKISRATQYYTPMFEPGSNGRLQQKDRRACINIEGSCIVDQFLYNWVSKSEPWGRLYVRNDVAFKFGKGSGQSYYNTTNALDPCRTVAADTNKYPVGTVIYVPAMRGKLCPQNGQPIDGCFIVGDIGSAIKGNGRFDLFAGECSSYSSSNNTCADPLMDRFNAPKDTPFYLVGRHNMWAKALREEVDLLINNNWRSGRRPPPPVWP